jgi:hypothetical protein
MDQIARFMFDFTTQFSMPILQITKIMPIKQLTLLFVLDDKVVFS